MWQYAALSACLIAVQVSADAHLEHRKWYAEGSQTVGKNMYLQYGQLFESPLYENYSVFTNETVKYLPVFQYFFRRKLQCEGAPKLWDHDTKWTQSSMNCYANKLDVGGAKRTWGKKCKWKVCMHCPQCLEPCTDQTATFAVTKRACLCVEDKTEDFFAEPLYDETGLKYVASIPRLEKTCLTEDYCNNSLNNNVDGYCYQPFVPTPAPPTPTPPTPKPATPAPTPFPPTPLPPTMMPPTPGPPTPLPPTPLPPLQVQSIWYFHLTAKCRKTCWDQKQEWSQKCTWKSCGACKKCLDSCDKRCFDSPKGWQKLCSWKMCGLCPMCPNLATPVPPTPLPPTPEPPTPEPPTPAPPTFSLLCDDFDPLKPITETCHCNAWGTPGFTLCPKGSYCYPGMPHPMFGSIKMPRYCSCEYGFGAINSFNCHNDQIEKKRDDLVPLRMMQRHWGSSHYLGYMLGNVTENQLKKMELSTNGDIDLKRTTQLDIDEVWRAQYEDGTEDRRRKLRNTLLQSTREQYDMEAEKIGETSAYQKCKAVSSLFSPVQTSLDINTTKMPPGCLLAKCSITKLPGCTDDLEYKVYYNLHKDGGQTGLAEWVLPVCEVTRCDKAKCQLEKQGWDKKCSWGICSKCDECYTPAPPPPPAGVCRQTCESEVREKDWAVKCEWDMCATCSRCERARSFEAMCEEDCGCTASSCNCEGRFEEGKDYKSFGYVKTTQDCMEAVFGDTTCDNKGFFMKGRTCYCMAKYEPAVGSKCDPFRYHRTVEPMLGTMYYAIKYDYSTPAPPTPDPPTPSPPRVCFHPNDNVTVKLGVNADGIRYYRQGEDPIRNVCGFVDTMVCEDDGQYVLVYFPNGYVNAYTYWDLEFCTGARLPTPAPPTPKAPTPTPTMVVNALGQKTLTEDEKTMGRMERMKAREEAKAKRKSEKMMDPVKEKRRRSREAQCASFCKLSGKDLWWKKCQWTSCSKCEQCATPAPPDPCMCTGNEGKASKQSYYPLDMGSSCKAWDGDMEYCKAGGKSFGESWCPDEWCYTSEKCPDAVKGTYFADMDGADLYYSYGACGAKDGGRRLMLI